MCSFDVIEISRIRSLMKLIEPINKLKSIKVNGSIKHELFQTYCSKLHVVTKNFLFKNKGLILVKK